jgi:catechol 2,3-dioxygenase-like lactoylglutathione lyase family enzyme
MVFQLSNCVALGVSDMRKAAEFYEKNLGYERGKESSGWIEMRSGALRIFLCNDEVHEPTFALEVEDVDKAVEHLMDAGFKRVVFDPNDTEPFMRDPYGYLYAISAKA